MGKRIVFTVTNDLTYDQRMHRICTTLQDAGYQVTLVGFTKKRSVPLVQNKYATVRLNPFFKKGKLFYLEYNFRLLLWLIKHPSDIYGAVDLDTLLPHVLISSWRKKICVHDAHEYFTELPEIAHRPVIKSLWEWMARMLLPKVPYNYTVCTAIAHELQQRYGTTYAVIRNVPEMQPEMPVRDPVSPPVFLYQGALNRGRGIEQMMEAIGHVDASLWLAGEGDLSDELRQKAAAFPWADRIRFLGYIEPRVLPSVTAQAFAGMNLVSNDGKSYYYSLSNKFFDYIRTGIPQITMNYPEYRSLNEQYGVALTINSLEVADIRRAMESLLTNHDLYSQLAQNTVSAFKELNWEVEKMKLLQFYEHVS